MDPVQKIWMFNNWIQDQQDNIELAKNHAYLLGSFYNPEVVKKLIDDTNKFVSSDEDFDETTKKLRMGMFDENKVVKNKKRKKRRLK